MNNDDTVINVIIYILIGIALASVICLIIRYFLRRR
jgi:hypothetical protein